MKKERKNISHVFQLELDSLNILFEVGNYFYFMTTVPCRSDGNDFVT